jgi:Uma2 family endonuclease
MNAMQVAQRITADEYLAYDGEERRTWLVDGQIVVNQPSFRHQALHGRLFAALDGWIEAGDARGFVVSPLDVQLDDHNVYAPDLLWYQASRVPAFDARGPYPLPDLAVEIRSPSTWRYDVGTKKRVYEREGLPELWLVDGESGVVLVFRRSTPSAPVFDVELELDVSATLTSPLLPGFALDVGALFALSRRPA